ncbi:hypothetical protein ABB37_05850 [Leptomonas pyrrhocoris]|uniref:Uncharacterized protein n=1 Tax=Leptomonas pyrrhocoris TaxID=157538 RepID=A0A0N0DUD6_LEPPY|nr:hypothetical protein ABB37_05850 [Leptomonas pyrrhocoris]XP_015657161.1 hypothetical protein ABB37_05850 [Leptomonas pyrrhocoris]KPA78721.1 hypothetical protein ABB37_05850 [Leptomonas pyrrhocoris]KPA78722.1 hypothetical protein ABB37_05850 [Leptomonas pyrrhocoris]|eukprot:XP_015657160.1 hypothetical protein ABB37_05850 [Leptomonas pyrrhocoris]
MPQFASTEALTRFVEGQSHHERCRTLLDVGRTSVLAKPPDSTTAQHIICELAQPSQVHYHRLLSAYALRGAFAEAKLKATAVQEDLWKAALSLLDDPSLKVAQIVMTPLLTAAARPSSETSSASFSPSSFLLSAPLPQFKSFVSKLRQCGQQALLVQLYASKTVADPAKQQYLLGHLSPADFEKLSEEDQASLDSAALRLLCRFHGAWVASYLTRRVEAVAAATTTPTVDALLRRHVTQAFHHLASNGGATHALALFIATAHLLGLAQGELLQLLSHHFMRLYPVEVGTYLLDGAGRTMLASFQRRMELRLTRHSAGRLKGQTDLILRMMEHGILCAIQSDPEFLPREVRQRLYDTQRSSMTTDNGVLRENYMRRLPREEDRVAEARVNYAHRALQDDPYGRLSYLSFVPFPEAVQLGAAYIASNDAGLRAAAVTSLLQSLRYFPEHVDAALDFCLRRTKEQDPWKTTMYDAWSALPRGFWRHTRAYLPDATLLEKLQQLLDATYSAKDLSQGTLNSVQELLCGLVGPHPDFALPRLLQLISKWKEFTSALNGTKPFGYVALLYPQVIPRVVTELLRVAQKSLHDNKYFAYVNIMEVFLSKSRKHVPHVLPLRLHHHQENGSGQQATMQASVKAALHAGMNSTSDYAAGRAFDLYYRNFPAEAVAGLPSLLETNLDWVTREAVQTIVCNLTQGPLLDRLVTPLCNIPTGRFYETEDATRAYICHLPLSYAYRWTAHQQRTYAQAILKVIYGKSNINIFSGRDFVTALARLPSVSSSTAWTSSEGVSYSLLTLATEQHPEHGDYLKGFALQALGLLVGDAAAVTALQAALEVPDTRIDALRALTRTLRCASSAEAVRVLEPLLTGKQVTAQKEALYLLGSKRDEVAYRRLVRFAAERQLPMPEEDAEGNAIHRAAGEEEEEKGVKSINTASDSTAAAPVAMHRDVRTALVTTLFHYLSKPQVWAYYDRLLARDCSGAEAMQNDNEGAAAVKEDSASEEEEADVAKEGEGKGKGEEMDEKPCASAAACEAMTTLPWINLRLPWQLARYQALLTGLLRHPKRDVSVAALNKLATVPPYTNMELCRAAAAYLDDCTNPRLVRSALQCMMRCTAEDSIPYVVSVILRTPADPSLQTIADVFASLTSQADPAMKPRFYRVIEGVATKLTAAHRQPTLIVRFIAALPSAQFVAQLMAAESAGILHTGAAYAAVASVRNSESLLRDLTEAEAFELSTLRRHPSALLRRMGLEVVLQVRSRKGWTDSRRAAVVAYQHDSDLWVSSDALVVRMT